MALNVEQQKLQAEAIVRHVEMRLENSFVESRQQHEVHLGYDVNPSVIEEVLRRFKNKGWTTVRFVANVDGDFLHLAR